MLIKKLTAAAGAAILASSLLASPVLAHGHGGGHHRQTAGSWQTESQQASIPPDYLCPVCTVEGCAETGHHLHDGADYCGYQHSGGYCDGSCGFAESGCDYGHGCYR